jgi:hypothetical protein
VQWIGRSWRDFEPAERFRTVVNAPDFSLAEAAFTMSAVVRRAGDDARGVESTSEFDLVEQLACLDELAAAVETPTSHGVARFLFGSGRFRGNVTNYQQTENSLLDVVLERGLGIPITLSVLMVEVAGRVGVSLCGVGLPGHFVVGEIDGVARIPNRFFDPFHGGAEVDAEDCRDLVNRLAGRPVAIPPECWYPASGVAIVERMLNNLKAIGTTAVRAGDPSALLVLRSVMWLRSCLPTIGESEREEWSRLVAPLN